LKLKPISTTSTTPLTKFEQKQTEEDRYVGPGSDRHKQVAGLN
jgi:hypothetical protein